MYTRYGVLSPYPALVMILVYLSQKYFQLLINVVSTGEICFSFPTTKVRKLWEITWVHLYHFNSKFRILCPVEHSVFCMTTVLLVLVFYLLGRQGTAEEFRGEASDLNTKKKTAL